jgi:hypothetical protein
MGQREERSRREGRPQSTARRRAEEHQSGYSTKTLKLPEGVKFYKKKEGMARLTILPYTVGNGNPFARPGETHYERTFFTYYKVGPGEDSYVCSSKTFNKPDFIQEERQRQSRKGADAEYLKTLSPRERQIFLVFDNDAPKEGIQLYEDAHFNFGKLLDERIKRSPESRGWDLFYLADADGFDLEITFGQASMGSGSPYTKALAIDFLPRDAALPEQLANHGFCLDDFIVETPYEVLKAAFLGETVGGAEDGQHEEREEYQAPDRGRQTQAQQTHEAPPPSATRQEQALGLAPVAGPPKPRTAMGAGLGKGDQVYYNQMVYDIMRISGDGTSLTLIRELPNGEDDIQKGIGVDDVKKALAQNETPFREPAGNGKVDHPKQEPVPAATSTATAKGTEKEFDDEWD